MDFEALVLARRSIRKFKENDVSPELVDRLLEYANAAPSAGNLKPWRFVVIRSETARRRVTAATYQRNSEKNPPQEWIASAPVIIAVCCDLLPVMGRYGRHALDNIVYLDSSAAVENILLGCVHLGLGATYISGFRSREMADALGLPDHVEPVALIPLGYPAIEGVHRPETPVEELTYSEVWGQKYKEQD